MSRRSSNAEAFDRTVYPVEERVGEHIVQRWIAEVLRPLLAAFLAHRKILAFVGADQFIYYAQYDAHKRFAPDVYVLPGVRPDTLVGAWKIWETGIAPSFCLEVVSDDWEKDYVETPDRCAAAGVKELVVFDPHWRARPREEGARWQVFRRVGRSGFRHVLTTDEDRVRSKELGCWLVEVTVGNSVRLRLGLGKDGHELFPTAAEAEQAAKEAALAEVRRLRAQLERLRRK